MRTASLGGDGSVVDFRDGATLRDVTGRSALAWGLDCNLSGRKAVSRLGAQLPDEAADLLAIAAAVHIADRVVRRPGRREDPYGLHRGRRLTVHVPVRLPKLWQTKPVRGALDDLLAWLTADSWSLHFSDGSTQRPPFQDGRMFLFDALPADPMSVVLFSGGLDSTAGVAAALKSSPLSAVVAVSVATNSRMAAVQDAVLEHLRSSADADVRLVPASFRFQMRRKTLESTQRSRGLLFLAAGVATAWTCRQSELQVFENGLGAHNLPYLRSQVGPQATRSVHPATLALMGRLATAVSGCPFAVVNPYQHRTKAELVAGAPDSQGAALRASVSCDSGFASRSPLGRLCGHCTSCLLRRQSLLAADRSDVDTDDAYRHDLRGPDGAVGAVELDAMLWQVGRLRDCLSATDPWRRLVDDFPELVHAPGTDRMLVQQQLIDLYLRYCAEWTRVAPMLGVRLDRWRAVAA